MTAIQLPTGGINSCSEFPIQFHQEFAPAREGPVQRALSASGRWGFDVTISAKTAADAREWKRLHQSGELFLFDIPQPGLAVGTPGTPRVAGASQTGNTLNIDGLTPGYTLALGQWLSIVIDGQRYAYMSEANSTADGTGALTAYLMPALRVSPNDNDVVEIETPKMEGYVDVPQGGFRLDVASIMRGLSFTIRERR